MTRSEEYCWDLLEPPTPWKLLDDEDYKLLIFRMSRTFFHSVCCPHKIVFYLYKYCAKISPGSSVIAGFGGGPGRAGCLKICVRGFGFWYLEFGFGTVRARVLSSKFSWPTAEICFFVGHRDTWSGCDVTITYSITYDQTIVSQRCPAIIKD